jgi:hypothetical protein
MKITTIAALSIVTAATALPLAATAQAVPSYQFQSPSGNIACHIDIFDTGQSFADCEAADHTWVAPPRSPDCQLAWGDRFRLEQGSAAVFACYHQGLRIPGEQTLGYGQTQSAGTITCDSEPTGMTCTDSSTGHFFRMSRDSYQLG